MSKWGRFMPEAKMSELVSVFFEDINIPDSARNLKGMEVADARR